MEVARLILDFVLGLVRALAWPLVATIAIILLRREIGSLLARARRGELDALGVRLRLDLETARDAADAALLHGESNPRVTESVQQVQVKFADLFEGVDQAWADIPAARSLVTKSFLALMQTVGRCADLLGVAATSEEANRPDSGGSYRVNRLRLGTEGIVDVRLGDVLSSLEAIYGRSWKGEAEVDMDSARLFTQTAYSAAQAVTARTAEAVEAREAASSISEGLH